MRIGLLNSYFHHFTQNLQVIGIGSGSTVVYAVNRIGKFEYLLTLSHLNFSPLLFYLTPTCLSPKEYLFCTNIQFVPCSNTNPVTNHNPTPNMIPNSHITLKEKCVKSDRTTFPTSQNSNQIDIATALILSLMFQMMHVCQQTWKSMLYVSICIFRHSISFMVSSHQINNCC